MHFIQKRQRVKVEQFSLSFSYQGKPGTGFSFPCNREGTPLTAQMCQAAIDNLADCMKGVYDVTFEGIRDDSYTFWEPAVLRCTCGAAVSLESSWANTCTRCGLEYNGFGQLLATRSQWENDC